MWKNTGIQVKYDSINRHAKEMGSEAVAECEPDLLTTLDACLSSDTPLRHLGTCDFSTKKGHTAANSPPEYIT